VSQDSIAVMVTVGLLALWAMVSTGLVAMLWGPEPLPASLRRLNRRGWPGVPPPKNVFRRVGTILFGVALLLVSVWIPLSLFVDASIRATPIERLAAVSALVFMAGWLALLSLWYLINRRGDA
jgi:hypothetical protein